MLIISFKIFRSYDQNKNLSEFSKTKYNAALDLCADMCYRLSRRRPNCEEILEKKNLWALNKEELEINDELKNIIASKERENEFTIYSILRSEINLFKIENQSSRAVTLMISRSPEQTHQVSQQKRRNAWYKWRSARSRKK